MNATKTKLYKEVRFYDSWAGGPKSLLMTERGISWERVDLIVQSSGLDADVIDRPYGLDVIFDNGDW